MYALIVKVLLSSGTIEDHCGMVSEDAFMDRLRAL
jgi:hypothetical protein